MGRAVLSEEGFAISDSSRVLSLFTHNAEETEKVGRFIGERLVGGDVVLLSGSLGAGKTCLVRGMAAGLGYTEPVASPTFALAQEYRRGDGGFVHADLYRISSAAELAGIGLDEYLDPRWILAVEWAEKFPFVWPFGRLEVALEVAGEDERKIEIVPRGIGWETRVREWNMV